MAHHLIELKHVTVEYRTPGQPPRRVLEDLSLTVKRGDFLTVCGQTGCGKSTMLRLILGAELPQRGQVLTEGRELPRPDRHRGYVPQKYSLFPDKTVLGNILFGPVMEEFGLLGRLTPRFHSRRKELRGDAMNLLRQMGLDDSDAGKYPDQLSGGMQQRVAIAQALIMKPKVLLMDEAFSALDPATRGDMQRLVRTLWARTGTTILFVTHNIAEALYLGNRVMVLGRETAQASSRIVADLEVPEAARDESGQLSRQESDRLTRVIQASTTGSRVEYAMAGLNG
jgi:NitT/TauT family transport system ATP-binding protein